MTPFELQILACGVAIGAYTMTLLHMWWDARDARRNLRASCATRKRAAADRYLSSFRLHQMQARRAARPHPAEFLEASFRDFELKLRDGLDRVEDAARRDGLL
ncbi:hypothetical protein [Streptomyces griseosporeus]|uniref:hypothetical protein n=1 Tax=Streptomyces griseosporeus TaxID=1910 RepID=UPI0036FC7BC9